MLPIIDKIIPINEFSRPGTKLKAVKGIVLHYTADPGARADQIGRYFGNLAQQDPNDSEADTYASAQYGVDPSQLIRYIPDGEMAYEVGAKSYKQAALDQLSSYPNNVTIGIEMCINEDGEIEEGTFQNAADLAAWLCEKYDLTSNDLWRHYDITGKYCPGPWVDNPSEFARFRQAVEDRLHPTPAIVEYITVVVKGKKLNTAGLLQGDRSWCPVRSTGLAAGATIGFDNGKAILNGNVLDSTIVVGGLGFASSREIAQALGLNVEWNGSAKTVSFK
jgi:N-acetylmuramoyl-L-alanine amidase